MNEGTRMTASRPAYVNFPLSFRLNLVAVGFMLGLESKVLVRGTQEHLTVILISWMSSKRD